MAAPIAQRPHAPHRNTHAARAEHPNMFFSPRSRFRGPPSRLRVVALPKHPEGSAAVHRFMLSARVASFLCRNSLPAHSREQHAFLYEKFCTPVNLIRRDEIPGVPCAVRQFVPHCPFRCLARQIRLALPRAATAVETASWKTGEIRSAKVHATPDLSAWNVCIVRCRMSAIAHWRWPVFVHTAGCAFKWPCAVPDCSTTCGRRLPRR